MRKAILLVALLTPAAACGASDGDGSLPAPTLSAEEIERLSAEAEAFADMHMGVWPDVEAFVSVYADDITGADPSARDSAGGKQSLLAMWEWWDQVTDHTMEVTGTFISADGAAYKEQWHGLWPTDVGWPVEGPRDPAGLSYFETYTFEGGKVVESDVWWHPADNVRIGIGCFVVDGCPALQETVDRYIAAWTARDRDAIAALYADQAQFTDGLLDIRATGPGAIGSLADERFGSVGEVSIEVLDLFAWTDGYGQPSEADPNHGNLLGVTIHYRVTVSADDVEQVQESVTTLELGHRYVRDLYTHVDPDPDGLIHREIVYHEPGSLLDRIATEV